MCQEKKWNPGKKNRRKVKGFASKKKSANIGEKFWLADKCEDQDKTWVILWTVAAK